MGTRAARQLPRPKVGKLTSWELKVPKRAGQTMPQRSARARPAPCALLCGPFTDRSFSRCGPWSDGKRRSLKTGKFNSRSRASLRCLSAEPGSRFIVLTLQVTHCVPVLHCCSMNRFEWRRWRESTHLGCESQRRVGHTQTSSLSGDSGTVEKEAERCIQSSGCLASSNGLGLQRI